MHSTLYWLGLALAAAALPHALEARTADGFGATRTHVRRVAIPAFARKYRTGCLTCHVMPPRLNATGEAFRLNGYRFPEGDAELVRDSTVAMGAPEWRGLFPNAVWPSTLPGTVPIALRIVSEQESRAHANTDLRFPTFIQLLMAGTFDETVGFFFETVWTPGSGALISQTFIKAQDVLRFVGLPRRALNVWVGKFDQNLLPSYRMLENVYRNQPLWGNVRLADLRVDSAGVNRTSGTLFRGNDRQPGIELNGILGRRLGYAFGVVQGVEANRDVDNHKDLYYTLRLKAGGRALDGSLGPGLARETGGRWVDNAVQLEHFGYVGRQGVDPFRRSGLALHVTYRNLDAAWGYVWGAHDQPWARAARAEFESWFGRADYMVFPWLMASARIEDLRITPSLPTGWRVTPGGAQDLQRVLPTLVVLFRANMRIVVEGEIYTHDAAVAADRRQHALGTRLDFAF